MHALPHSGPPTRQQATTNPCLHRRLLDTHRQVWVTVLRGHCSFLLGPSAHKVLFVPSKSVFPQYHVSSGGSMGGLIANSYKRAYTPRGLMHLKSRWKHCWSWNSNNLATWFEEQTHWKRPWYWERLKAGREGDNRGWDGWMASPPWWTWVWASSGSWWWTGKPGVLQSMVSQRAGHDWTIELTNWCL